MQTLLALMAKGVHIYGRGKRNDDPNELRRNAYVDFATALNEALHGEDYTQDISKKEVTRMIDQVLVKRKRVVGKGGLMERQHGGRITRSLNLAFKRGQQQDYDGSVSEWNNGRRAKVLARHRKQQGLPSIRSESGDDSQASKP
jgi:hypothetical protein